eukprot:3193586-Amphidinium_carterae.1
MHSPNTRIPAQTSLSWHARSTLTAMTLQSGDKDLHVTLQGPAWNIPQQIQPSASLIEGCASRCSFFPTNPLQVKGTILARSSI